MSRLIPPLLGAALGSAAMYLLDPDRGRRRRAVLRDRLTRETRELKSALEAGTRDLRHRGYGLAARAQGVLRRGDAPDDVLAGRVRARMGRLVSHPGAIDVTVRAGEIILSGDVLEHERAGLLAGMRSVPGVSTVSDEGLNVHANAEGVSALQGSGRERPAHDRWRPGPRLAAGAAGTTLLVFGLVRAGLNGLMLGAAGSLILLRSMANRPLAEIARLAPSGSIHVRKSLTIDATLDEVYEFVANPENFPRVMRNVRAVDRRADGLTRWTVAGPAGAPVSWDAEIVAETPNEHIAWRTLPGSAVDHEGAIDLEADGTATRVHVRLSYRPPAGALGHGVARLFGADPATELDEDLMRLKQALEAGNTPLRDTPPPPREKTETPALLARQ
jgi:uncharacterized membrane protein